MPRYARGSLEERFFAKIEIRGDCWIWQGFTNSKGYGRLLVNSRRTEQAHRVAWFIATGEWPTKGQLICHDCDTPSCVQFGHLWPGSHADNTADMMAKGRGVPPPPAVAYGENHPGAVLTEKIVREARLRVKAGESRASVARSYGVQRKTLCIAVDGITWGWLQ